MSNNLENYEEKYNQALKRAKEFMTNKGVSPNADAFKTAKELTETIFPELKESEDERIRKEIIDFIQEREIVCSNGDSFLPYKKWIAWLEKQGEHANFRNKIQVGDEVTKNEDGVLVNLSQLKRVAKPSEKSANKNKPKFKVGDWITNGEYTWKVIDIKPLDYLLQAQNGDVVGDTISYVDEEFHLWTIGDAKDGDVLSDEKPFIFRGFGDREHPHNPTAYCGITSSGTFILSTENEWWTADDFYPATKEQCDILFRKMKEEGYVWYAEKKELKKIEQKSSWSEEDEEMIDFMIEFIESLYWRKDLTKRKDEVLSWLKSIKPQKRWKPSEEQMEAIKFCCANFEEYDALKSLYNDLKGLNLC